MFKIRLDLPINSKYLKLYRTKKKCVDVDVYGMNKRENKSKSNKKLSKKIKTNINMYDKNFAHSLCILYFAK